MPTPEYPLLIGLAGRAQVGKDTVGARLCDTHGLRRLAFADPIKDMVAAMLGMERHVLDAYPKEMELPYLGVSPRALYQTLGTEWGRETIGRDVWLKLAGRQWLLACCDSSFVGMVITDVRMSNEAAWVRAAGGVVVHIERTAATPVRAHISEMPLPVLNGDYRLTNNGTVDELYRRLDDLIGLLAYGRLPGQSPRVLL